jgi:hypothetical protein
MQLNRLFLVTIILGLATTLITSCFFYKETSTNIVYKSTTSKRNYLAIKTFTHSHCGCTDIYAQRFDNGNLAYEFYYGCTPFFTSQKIVYKYGSDNNIIGIKKFKPVETDKYDIDFDSLDLVVLQKIDSFRVNQNAGLPEYKLCKKDYKGFLNMQ